MTDHFFPQLPEVSVSILTCGSVVISLTCTHTHAGLVLRALWQWSLPGHVLPGSQQTQLLTRTEDVCHPRRGGRADTPSGRRGRTEGSMLPVQSLHHFQTNRCSQVSRLTSESLLHTLTCSQAVCSFLLIALLVYRWWAQSGNKDAHGYFPKGFTPPPPTPHINLIHFIVCSISAENAQYWLHT